MQAPQQLVEQQQADFEESKKIGARARFEHALFKAFLAPKSQQRELCVIAEDQAELTDLQLSDVHATLRKKVEGVLKFRG